MKNTLSLLFFLAVTTFCIAQPRDENLRLQNRLPEEMSIVSMHGNYWYTIEVREVEFLYHFYGSGTSGFECITKVGKNSFPVNPIPDVQVDMNIYGDLVSDLPLNCSIVEILGKGWFILEIEKETYYLYHKTGQKYGAESLTRLN